MPGLLFRALFLLFCQASIAQAPAGEFSVPGIPGKLSWINQPVQWNYRQGILEITAGAKTDLFIDPRHEYAVTNSPQAVFDVADSFMLSAKVTVGFKTDFDAGVLTLYAGDDAWAKLCFEFSPQKSPFVVSVVNNAVSDDCNHVPIKGNTVYLRITGLCSRIFAFHYSTDGKYWNLVRYFIIKGSAPVRAGFSSQSPTGKSCQAVFSAIRYSPRKLIDIRNGK